MFNFRNNNSNNSNDISIIIKHAYKYLREWFVLFIISFSILALNAGLCHFFSDPEFKHQHSLIMKIVIVVFCIYAVLTIYRYVRLFIVLIPLHKNAIEIKAMYNANILKTIYGCYAFPLVFAFVILPKIRSIYKKTIINVNNIQTNTNKENNLNKFAPADTTIKRIDDLDKKIDNIG